MNIQSLSVVVPNKSCMNHCKFCVSRMHCNDYDNCLDENSPKFNLYLDDYLKRLQFARDNGCNTIMLTGTSEPQQNRKFLTWFGMFQRMLKNPFEWIEMQTTGIMLDDDYLEFLRNHVGVNLISLSLASLDSDTNCNIIGCHDKLRFDIEELCKKIKAHGFTLRLSLNLTSEYNICGMSHYDHLSTDCWDQARNATETLFEKCEKLGADQITFRVLYRAIGSCPEAIWVDNNTACDDVVEFITDYIHKFGKKIGVLPYGNYKHDLCGMSVVIDGDCMAKDPKSDVYKYLILRPDCKLYSSWDSKASLIF